MGGKLCGMCEEERAMNWNLATAMFPEARGRGLASLSLGMRLQVHRPPLGLLGESLAQHNRPRSGRSPQCLLI